MSERVILSSGLKGSLTVTVTSALGLAEEPKRNFLYLTNKSADADEVVWLAFGEAAVEGEGIPLIPGAPPLVMRGQQGIYTGDVYFISSKGSPKVAYQTLTSNL